MDALFAKIKLLITDVDGVMTAGHIIISDNGEETKFFNVYDGLGIILLLKENIEVAVISARDCASVSKRCEALGIQHVFQGIKDKRVPFEALLKKLFLQAEEVAYIGDDWQDLGVLRRVGLPIAVTNAVPEVKAAAKYVTEARGGEGAVREVAMKLLKAQGKYEKLLNETVMPA